MTAEITNEQTQISTKFNGDLSLSYGMNQYAETFSKAYKRPNNMQNISLSLEIPIFQWGINRNKRRMSAWQYESTEIELRSKLQEFESNLKDQVATYNHNNKILKFSEQTYLLSKKQMQLAVNKFSVGNISVYELLSVNKQQNEALLNYITTLTTAYASLYALRTLTLYDFVTDENIEKQIRLETLMKN